MVVLVSDAPLRPELLWLLIATLGIGTFLIRVSFLELFEFFEEIPDWLEDALRFIPVAVLTAIVLPHIVTLDASLSISISERKLVAGTAAAVVAWRTDNMLATLAVGMGVLWGLTFVI